MFAWGATIIVRRLDGERRRLEADWSRGGCLPSVAVLLVRVRVCVCVCDTRTAIAWLDLHSPPDDATTTTATLCRPPLFNHSTHLSRSVCLLSVAVVGLVNPAVGLPSTMFLCICCLIRIFVFYSNCVNPACIAAIPNGRFLTWRLSTDQFTRHPEADRLHIAWWRSTTVR